MISFALQSVHNDWFAWRQRKTGSNLREKAYVYLQTIEYLFLMNFKINDSRINIKNLTFFSDNPKYPTEINSV